jgi:hypothetical protein
MADVPKHVEIILRYDRVFRSQILYEAIALEAVLDSIIAQYFCPDKAKHPAFVSFIFQEGEISFGKKIRMVANIMKHSYPDLKEAFGFLPKRLDVLRQLRNKFAHSEVVLPEAPPPPERAEGVTLRYIKRGALVEEFVSRGEIDDLVKECFDLHIVALLLAILVGKRATEQAEPEEEKAFISVARALGKR